MIEETYAESQVMRLEQLIGFPRAAAALNDLICAVQAADTEAIAKQIIDRVMDFANSDTRCPLAPYLRGEIHEANERAAIREAEINPPSWTPHCPACRDTGITESSHVDDLSSIAAYCACVAGSARARRYDDDPPDRVNASRAKLRSIGIRGLPVSQGLRRSGGLTRVGQ